MGASGNGRHGVERGRGAARSRLAMATALATAGLVMATGSHAGPGTVPAGFQDVAVATGLNQPIALAFLPDGRALFLEYHTPLVGLIVNGARAGDPCGWLPDVRTSEWERGLLGIAVDPGWPARPYVYLFASDSARGTSRISRYRMGGDVGFTGNGRLSLQVASRHDLVDDIPDQAMEHNGGTLRFGPDGRLYAGIGDDFVSCDAQDPGVLRGKILRLDVSRLPDGPGSASRADVTPPDNPWVGHPDPDARLVWASGLRNPFRFDVDFEDGALYVGDVGEWDWEEIDRIPGGGRNLGWPRYEGLASFLTSCNAGGPDPPIHAYNPGTEAPAAITAIAVYRHPAVATNPFPSGYRGSVFFTDLYEGFLRRLVFDGGSWVLAPPVAGQPGASDWGRGFHNVVDYRVGPDGALWYVRMLSSGSFSGEIRRIVANPDVAAVGDGDTTGTPAPGGPPPALAFAPPWPQPARDRVHLRWQQPDERNVRLAIHGPDGRRLAQVHEGRAGAGTHTASWDGRRDDGAALAPGVYFAVLECGGERLTRRVLLAR